LEQSKSKAGHCPYLHSRGQRSSKEEQGAGNLEELGKSLKEKEEKKILIRRGPRGGTFKKGECVQTGINSGDEDDDDKRPWGAR
jgi:hypothetical protein